MVGEALVVAGSSLVVFCSLFEWGESLGYAFFHLVLIIVAFLPSLSSGWTVGIKKWIKFRQSAGDGVEIGSLLVPMVLTSQMAFIKRWGDKNLRVTVVDRSYLLASQLMGMVTVSILLFLNNERPLVSSFLFFLVTTCIGATINVPWDTEIMHVIVCVLLYFALLSAVLRHLPQCFTIGEAMIVTESVVLLSVDAFTDLGIKLSHVWPGFRSVIGIHVEFPKSTEMLWLQVLVIGSLTTGILLLPVFYYLSLVRDFWDVVVGHLAFYATIFFTFFALLLPWSFLILRGMNPLNWLWKYLTKQEIRLYLIAHWCCVVAVSVAFVLWKSRQTKSNASSTIVRKCFHLLALAIYIPGVIYEPYVTHLASSVAVAAFIFIEYVRLFRIGPFGSSVHSALVVFLDDKDSGALILTHVYLLLGLALPLWLFPVDYSKADPTGCKLALYSGILALGIGDTMASVVGKTFGRLRWPGSLKTVEGTLAGIISQLLFVWTLQCSGLLSLPSERWLHVSLAVTAGSLLEAWTSQIDNIILSPFLSSLLMFKCT